MQTLQFTDAAVMHKSQENADFLRVKSKIRANRLLDAGTFAEAYGPKLPLPAKALPLPQAGEISTSSRAWVFIK
ncbi:hypothetical protein [Mesorhizobium sp.]|uniref:hypothetical protein n=1 Tax=Mesorhizobium sp. TaxID=1871066 RepID=UPI000FE800D7|nr:hypothetical protein [Mesorhizobium sp.]RWP24498.1 MAG: hypothetical protein EOR02_30895 [Mesorhizobium sp.]